MSMLPLWRHDEIDRFPIRTVPARGVAFECLGRRFVYDPDDMRLHRTDDPGAVLRERQIRGEVARKPQFDLADTPPRTVVLVTTLACNLRCRYCFARPGGTACAATLSRADARAALGLVPPDVDGTLGFFGGEPLLTFDRIRETVADARALPRRRPFAFTLTTNAVLLGDEQADFLARHDFGLVVSLDGPAPLHDANRPDAAGAPTHDRVVGNLERLARRHPRLAARVTLRGTYDGSRPALTERVLYLNDLARRLGLANVSVEPADLAESCSRPSPAAASEASGGAVPVTPSPALVDEYFETARWYAAEIKAGRRPLFHHFGVRIERLRQRRPAPSECGAGVGYLTVAPDGTLHACHRLGDSVVGRLRDGVDRERQAEWRDNRYYQRVGCRECWLRNACGGGCRLASRHRFGDWRRPDPLGCWLTDVCFRSAAWILSEIA